MGAVGVEELQAAGPENLEAIVKVGSGGEVLGSEAGAGVVDLKQFDWSTGAVGDGGGDVVGVAASYCNEDDDGDTGDRTHESQEYQPAREALFGG